MFALCSDSRKGSWRHAETLLASAGSTDIMVPPRSTKSAPFDNFLFFSSKGKQPSWQKNKVKLPLIWCKNLRQVLKECKYLFGNFFAEAMLSNSPQSWISLLEVCGFCRLPCLLSLGKQVSSIMWPPAPSLHSSLSLLSLVSSIMWPPAYLLSLFYIQMQVFSFHRNGTLTSLELTRIKLCALHRNAFYEITSMRLKPATMLVSLLKANTTWQVFGGCPVLSPTC